MLATNTIVYCLVTISMVSSCIGISRVAPSNGHHGAGGHYDWRGVPDTMQGFWDNTAQLEQEEAEGVPPEDRHSQISATFFEVNVPLFPQDSHSSLYLEEYADGNPELVYRQRLYVFSGAPQNPTFTLNQIYSFREPEKFLNGWENPEIFESLSSGDLQWNDGCDLLWRENDSLYTNNGTGDTCRTIISGRDTIIDVSNDMTENWLTVDYAFIDAESGDTIIGWPTPFNMTKVSDESPKHGKKRISSAWPWEQLGHQTRLSRMNQDFDSILEALVDGYEVEYAVNLTACSTLDDLPRTTDRQIIGGPIETFEYFYGERFGPVPYFGTSMSDIILTEDGSHRIQLTQVRLYSNETVRVRMVLGTLDGSSFDQYDILYCTAHDGPGGRDVFTVHDSQPLTQLTSYDDILEAMYSGATIRYSAHYYSCGPNPAETIGGSMVIGYDVNEGEDVITFNSGEIIVNYFQEEDGFLYNGATGYILSNSSTTEFQPWGIDYGTWGVRYVSFYDCAINDGDSDGGIYYYTQQPNSKN